MKQIQYAQVACGFDWSKDVRTNLLGPYLCGTAELSYNKQVDTWWGQFSTLAHVMERFHQTFKTTITATQSMKLFMAKKDSRGGRPRITSTWWP